MNSIEQLKAALGEPLKKTIGEQEFEFYPLPVTYLPDFYEIAQHIGSKPENATKEDISTVVKLIIAMVKESYPDWPEKDTNRFVMKFYPELQEILTELHTPETKDLKKSERIKELKERLAKKNEPIGQNQSQSPQ